MFNVARIFQWKNKPEKSVPIVLLEIEFAPAEFVRFARYNRPVTFQGFDWLPFPIAPLEIEETSTGQTPAFDIAFSNVGREFQSILEFYDVIGRTGRVLWVHPDDLADPTAAIEESFTIIAAHTDARNAAITVTSVAFDPLDVQLPRQLITHADYPGILGVRVAYLR